MAWVRLEIRLVSKSTRTLNRYDKLLSQAAEILARPIAEVTVITDGTVAIKPTGWTCSDVGRIAQVAFELLEFAADPTLTMHCSSEGE